MFIILYWVTENYMTCVSNEDGSTKLFTETECEDFMKDKNEDNYKILSF